MSCPQGKREEGGERHVRSIDYVGGPADRIDDAILYTQEQVLPQLQQMDGFKGFIALGDRHSGKVRGLALWESEEALRATEEAASRIRGGVAEATGGRVADVEQYEVTVFEVSS